MRDKEKLKLSDDCQEEMFKADVLNKLEDYKGDINSAFRKIRCLEANKVDKRTVGIVVAAIFFLMAILKFIWDK